MPTIAACRQPVTPNMTRACQDCGARLVLVDTPPAAIGTYARRFQCTRCDHVETVTTRSRWLGWLNSDLWPPV